MSSSILTVTVPATARALCTLAAVKDELGITGNASDQGLQDRISQASALIETHCRRVFARQTFQEIFRDVVVSPLILACHPISIVESITLDGTALAETEYELSAAAGLLYRLRDDRRAPWRAAKLVATYTAGYLLPGQDGANLPADLTRICIDRVKGIWQSKDRNTSVRSESTEGVDAISYFDPDKLSREEETALNFYVARRV